VELLEQVTNTSATKCAYKQNCNISHCPYVKSVKTS